MLHNLALVKIYDGKNVIVISFQRPESFDSITEILIEFIREAY